MYMVRILQLFSCCYSKKELNIKENIMSIWNKFFTLIALVFGILFLTATATAGGYSGFLDKYPDLKPDKDRAGAHIYEKPGYDLSAYTKVMIDPITIFIDPNSKYKGIDPDELMILAHSFRETIIQNLEPEYPVVGQQGAGVLRMRIAITNVKLKKKKKGLFSYTPIGMVASGVQSSAGKNINLVKASIEAELIDGKTGEQVGVLVDTQPHKGGEDEKPSWDTIQKTFEFYAKRFRQRMNEARK